MSLVTTVARIFVIHSRLFTVKFDLVCFFPGFFMVSETKILEKKAAMIFFVSKIH